MGSATGTYKAYVNGLGTNGGTKYRAAMQGFFVRATAPTADVGLTNTVRLNAQEGLVVKRLGQLSGPPWPGTIGSVNCFRSLANCFRTATLAPEAPSGTAEA
ncbi:hypothetical protein [Hymenobacter terricola]|uniref:hypothetical protein n=1 Tax=Hymenobacter terricola TaxID=2819236 RepID=UPI001B314D7A|nr:hypothetical protein [Hymenobacter terricola]